MYFRVFDVGHGFSALLVGDDGRTTLFDCGSDATRQRSPSAWLLSHGVRTLDSLVISHFDQDHISDLPALRQRVAVSGLACNWSIPPVVTVSQKASAGRLTTALVSALRLQQDHQAGNPTPPQLTSIVHFAAPYQVSTSSNDLSVVTFVAAGDVTILLPGDIGPAGWRYLLTSNAFLDRLRTVNVFVAPHHGRADAFHRPVFEHCSPEIVIVSDGPIQYDSQRTTQMYAAMARGVPLTVGGSRFVYSTRADGDIRVWQTPGQQAWISAVETEAW